MEEELKYTSKFNGEDTDSILEGAKKVINAELPSLDEIGGFMVYDKEGKAIGLMSSEQVSKVVSGLIGAATTKKDGLMPGELYSASTLSLFSGLGHQGGKARMYKVLTISNNTVFSCMVTSATIDKNPSVYSMSGAYAFNVLNIKIALINGVVEVEKTRFFYKREENGNLDIFVYLIRSDKQILFSQIRHGVGYMAISGEEVTISTEDKTEVQTS